VKKILADLKQHYSQNTKYSFTNGQYLALCLYMLEKDTHFTGDGIWSNGHDVKQQSLEKISVVEGIDNNTVQSTDNYLNSGDSHDINDDFNTKDNNDMDNHDDLDDEDETCMTKWQHT